MKFENKLAKKCKELEVLGDSLVFKEQEVLLNYKEKLEVAKMDKNSAMNSTSQTPEGLRQSLPMAIFFLADYYPLSSEW